jgi:hypothetical protein
MAPQVATYGDCAGPQLLVEIQAAQQPLELLVCQAGAPRNALEQLIIDANARPRRGDRDAALAIRADPERVLPAFLASEPIRASPSWMSFAENGPRLRLLSLRRLGICSGSCVCPSETPDTLRRTTHRWSRHLGLDS